MKETRMASDQVFIAAGGVLLGGAREQAPLRVEVTARLNASPERVFAAIGDLEAITRYMPMIRRAAVTHGSSGGTCGVGSERICALRNGMGTINETIVAWDPPSGFSYRASGSLMPMRDHLSEILIRQRTGNVTTIEWRHYFNSRFGPLGWLLPFMLRRMCREALINIAADLGVTIDFVQRNEGREVSARDQSLE
jgi:uncharacterized protein YndB with AHSA1/START domain